MPIPEQPLGSESSREGARFGTGCSSASGMGMLGRLPPLTRWNGELLEFPTRSEHVSSIHGNTARALDALDQRIAKRAWLTNYLEALPNIVRMVGEGRAGGRGLTSQLLAVLPITQHPYATVWLADRGVLRRECRTELEALERCLRIDSRGLDAQDSSSFLAVRPDEIEVAVAYWGEAAGCGTGRSMLELRKARFVIAEAIRSPETLRFEVDASRSGTALSFARYPNRVEITGGPDVVRLLASEDGREARSLLGEIQKAVDRIVAPPQRVGLPMTRRMEVGYTLGVWWLSVVEWFRSALGRRR